MSQKPAARIGDIGGPHGAYVPTPIIQGSPNVVVEKKPVARKGDALVPHTKPKSKPHGRSVGGGASTVLVNGKPVARQGDKISCGGKIMNGAASVVIGDSPKLPGSVPDPVFD